MSEPIAFVLMPFDVMPTGLSSPGVPDRVDFDALWELSYRPALERLGYQAVRADTEAGALMVSVLVQALTLADLVVVDMTLPKRSDYYAVGVRDAARNSGCVLVAADWSRPLFDLAQVRQLRFPLPTGVLDAAEAAAVAEVLVSGIPVLAGAMSPVFDAVPNFPDTEHALARSPFRGQAAELDRFENEAQRIAMAPVEQRKSMAREVVERYSSSPGVRDAVVLKLIRLLRDHVNWSAVLDYIATLPSHVASLPSVIEQRSLALAQAGDELSAARELEALIEREGETTTRLGLLGGRYKRLYRAAASPEAGHHYLDRAIESYQRGMDLDLNDYYCPSNLSRLYRDRNEPGDARRATDAEIATALACRAALRLGRDDQWTRATLLTNAFDRGDVAEASRLRVDVEAEGPSRWKMDTIIADLRASIRHHSDPEVRQGLIAVLGEFSRLESFEAVSVSSSSIVGARIAELGVNVAGRDILIDRRR